MIRAVTEREYRQVVRTLRDLPPDYTGVAYVVGGITAMFQHHFRLERLAVYDPRYMSREVCFDTADPRDLGLYEIEAILGGKTQYSSFMPVVPLAECVELRNEMLRTGRLEIPELV